MVLLLWYNILQIIIQQFCTHITFSDFKMFIKVHKYLDTHCTGTKNKMTWFCLSKQNKTDLNISKNIVGIKIHLKIFFFVGKIILVTEKVFKKSLLIWCFD